MGQYWQGGLLNTSAKVEKKQKKTIVTDAVVEYSTCAHYADNGMKLMEHSYIGNCYVNLFIKRLAKKHYRVIWAGDYNEADTINGELPYRFLGENETRPKKKAPTILFYRYLINHDKHEFVDLSKCREDKYGYVIHPLPLLTASRSNGFGGGDYRTENLAKEKLVGTWAYDVISVGFELPKRGEWKEIVPDFIEER